MMPRREPQDALRFEAARNWRAWHEWPGIMGLATGIALWVFFVIGVLAPVGDALARFRSPSVAPAQICATTEDGTIVAGGQPCVCACPESPPPESLPRSG